jgi:hypothetical protein
MPLIKSSSEPAFKSNLKAEIAAGKPQNQALAIAYRVKREGRAMGGPPPASWQTRKEAGAMTHSGPIMSAVAGRTDHHPMNVAAGSYVLPADHVSSLGQGNTQSGMAVLGHMFGSSGPLGIGKNPAIKHGSGAPAAPRAMKLAKGGAPENDGSPVPINAAGGEFVIPPEVVAEIGGGDIKRGHTILDNWVLANRKKHINTLKKLPGPAKS